MDQPTADLPSPEMPTMLDVQQPEGSSTTVPAAPDPPEELKSKSTGKRRGRDRKKDPDVNKHKTVAMKDTTTAENAAKLVVGEDGVSRVNVNEIDTSSCANSDLTPSRDQLSTFRFVVRVAPEPRCVVRASRRNLAINVGVKVKVVPMQVGARGRTATPIRNLMWARRSQGRV
jgi:hypothetical protein